MKGFFSITVKSLEHGRPTSWLFVVALLLTVFVIGCKSKPETNSQTSEQASQQKEDPSAAKRRFFRLLMRGGSFHVHSRHRLISDPTAIQKFGQFTPKRFDNDYGTLANSTITCLALRGGSGYYQPIDLPADLQFVEIYFFSDPDGMQEVTGSRSYFLFSDNEGDAFEHIIGSEKELVEKSTGSVFDYDYDNVASGGGGVEIKLVQIRWKPRVGDEEMRSKKFEIEKFGCLRINDKKLCDGTLPTGSTAGCQ